MNKKVVESVFEEEISKSIHPMKILIQVLKATNNPVTTSYWSIEEDRNVYKYLSQTSMERSKQDRQYDSSVDRNG